MQCVNAPPQRIQCVAKVFVCEYCVWRVVARSRVEPGMTERRGYDARKGVLG